MAAPATGQIPAAGDGFEVSLIASPSYAPVRQPITMTATTQVGWWFILRGGVGPQGREPLGPPA
jgi:hypothetical protein